MWIKTIPRPSKRSHRARISIHLSSSQKQKAKKKNPEISFHCRNKEVKQLQNFGKRGRDERRGGVLKGDDSVSVGGGEC